MTDIAAPLPLGVIGAMMGVPREDWGLMFTLTNRVLGAEDPEYQTVAGDGRETADQGLREMFSLLRAARHRAPPGATGRPPQWAHGRGASMAKR